MRKIDPVKHEQKKREILEAAGRCFAKDGFRGASISHICAEAKISSGHLYHYFANKETIIEAMSACGLEYAEQRFHHLTQSDNPIEALIAEIRQIKSKKKCAEKQLHMDMLAESGRNPAMAKIVRDHTAKIQKLLATLLREAQSRNQIDQTLDPDIAAAILISTLEGVGNLTARDPQLDINASLDMLSTLIMRFLRPVPEQQNEK
jgi:TetR/AcrR family transcriptional repressor of uid operon